MALLNLNRFLKPKDAFVSGEGTLSGIHLKPTLSASFPLVPSLSRMQDKQGVPSPAPPPGNSNDCALDEV